MAKFLPRHAAVRSVNICSTHHSIYIVNSVMRHSVNNAARPTQMGGGLRWRTWAGELGTHQGAVQPGSWTSTWTISCSGSIARLWLPEDDCSIGDLSSISTSLATPRSKPGRLRRVSTVRDLEPASGHWLDQSFHAARRPSLVSQSGRLSACPVCLLAASDLVCASGPARDGHRSSG